jgi:hypothetical protein
MAEVANAQHHVGLGGAGFDDVAAGATNFGFHVFRMNFRSHKSRVDTIPAFASCSSPIFINLAARAHLDTTTIGWMEPLTLPSPHFVGRGNWQIAWWWYQDAPLPRLPPARDRMSAFAFGAHR